MPVRMARIELPDDGERMVPEHHRETIAYADHIARYRSVAASVKGKAVLDIACGSGYGSHILGESAAKVTGVDIDQHAIDYASANFLRDNVVFKRGDAKNIPLEDGSVDVVVSFETLEHIEGADQFLLEVKRVLGPSGHLVLSTPNEEEFPKGNEFHTHEYNYDELQALVAKYFRFTQPYFQATWIATAIATGDSIFHDSEETIRLVNVAPIPRKRVLFFLLVCSDQPINIGLEPVMVTEQHWSAKELMESSDNTEKYIKDTIVHFEGIIVEKDQHLELKDQHLQLKDQQIAALSNAVAELSTPKGHLAWIARQTLGSARRRLFSKDAPRDETEPS
jgi:2-polyprenyl-3-methyl-5-hydroxy-6-metoxy-1,4-benzoquinol methylase